MPPELLFSQYLQLFVSQLAFRLVEHGCLSVDQRVKSVHLYAELISVTATQRRFRAIFHMRWAPSRNTILRLHRKFEEGTLLESKRPRTAHVRSP